MWKYLTTACNFISAADDPDAPQLDYVPQIPPEGTIFMEGYMQKRSRHANELAVWKRRFFTLECRSRPLGKETCNAFISYSYGFNTPPKYIFKLTSRSSVRISQIYGNEGFPKALVITELECQGEDDLTELNIFSAEDGVLEKWREMVQASLYRILDEEKKHVVLSRTRFYEGLVFKLTKHTPHKWMERHFELHGTKLVYKHTPLDETRFEIELMGAKITPGKTGYKSTPTPYLLRICRGDVTLNLCFPTQLSCLCWMKAVEQNLSIVVESRKKNAQNNNDEPSTVVEEEDVADYESNNTQALVDIML